MEDLGADDLFLCPNSGRCVLSWTPGMAMIEQSLRGKALVVSILSGRREVSPAMVVEELGSSCGILLGNVRVEVTRPSNFLITFTSDVDCSAVLDQTRQFQVAGAQLSFRLCTRMAFVVMLAIKGLPAHACESEALKQILNKLDCQLIEIFEPADAFMTEVLAWATKPSST
ncbi:hypothetical protein E2562_008935 [Oryza meyeriana var. granulata]|uniref:Uncharacterized protein n=1 Tax=Oryza meyeriana var. granulata TaxID=110450 RepID=A0A6G1D0R1_9ORYZ|nr:hypothetical protein E2562_008935 [Oryza meyeriana var. granulata]